MAVIVLLAAAFLGDRDEQLRRIDGEAARMLEALRGVRTSVESVERGSDGEVAIEALQAVAFDPPGVTSAVGGAMWTTFHHNARIHKTTDG